MARKRTERKSDEPDVFATDASRRGKYRFGSQQIQFYLPSRGVPSAESAKKKPKQTLKLEHVYGFKGNCRQNLYAKDGKLVYFLAAAGIVYDVAHNSQRFFLGHNDDLTTIALDARAGSSLVASGQKDPKDEPGMGKDLPKIHIWNLHSPEKSLLLLDDVCVNLVRRVQWSPATGQLYVICGDDVQTLKVYNTAAMPLDGGRFDKKSVAKVLVNQPTTRQSILGIVLNPKPKGCYDELFFFCIAKVLVAKLTEDPVTGKLKLGKLRAMQIKKPERSYPACIYLPSGRTVFGGGSGNVYMAQESKLEKKLKGLHKKAVTAIASNKKGSIIYTSSFDGYIKCLDSSGKEKWAAGPISVAGSDFRNVPVAMAYDKATDSLYIGSKTNQIVRFQLTTKEATVVIDGHDGQVWGLDAHPKKHLFATAGWDRAVKVWDPKRWLCLRTHEFPKVKKKRKAADSSDDEKMAPRKKRGKKKKATLPPDNFNISTAAASPNGLWLAVGTSESSVVVLEFATLSVKATLRIPLANPKSVLEGVECMRWAPNGKLLAVAHGDSNLYIVSMTVKKTDGGVRKPALKMWKGLRHRAAPSHIQWGHDSTIVKTLTRDYEVATWVLKAASKKAKLSVKCVDPDKYQFAGDPLVAGWDVQGLYQPGFDGTDLNDCSLTSDKKLLASGDDFGNVRLHRYPAVESKAHTAYPGHAEHVVGVQFLKDDEYLLSVGAADNAIFQWKVVR